uniref:Mitochondrial intermembrane space import and assembly protein 40 n=1 Tax=Plectus sambesii TaxID=2011161 RepID=A0A914XP56_9BILA
MFRSLLSLIGSSEDTNSSTMASTSSQAEQEEKEANQEKKDHVIMLTAEQDAVPMRPDVMAIRVSLDNDDDVEGPMLPNGEVNWQCPCMASLVSGPCGYEYRQAFGCFHASKEDPKGMDCIDKFAAMSECMQKYPNLYPVKVPNEDDEEDAEENDGTMSVDPNPQRRAAHNEKQS